MNTLSHAVNGPPPGQVHLRVTSNVAAPDLRLRVAERHPAGVPLGNRPLVEARQNPHVPVHVVAANLACPGPVQNTIQPRRTRAYTARVPGEGAPLNGSSRSHRFTATLALGPPSPSNPQVIIHQHRRSPRRSPAGPQHPRIPSPRWKRKSVP